MRHFFFILFLARLLLTRAYYWENHRAYSPLLDYQSPCRSGQCFGGEGETCSWEKTCRDGLDCVQIEMGASVCRCLLDHRLVCGLNKVTYRSVCEWRLREHSRNLDDTADWHWGPCENAPEIVNGPENVEVKSGSTLIMQCRLRGYPVPDVEWRFQRGSQEYRLPSDDHLTTVHLLGGPGPLMTTSWLQVESVATEDSGTYLCVMSNRHGNKRSAATVTVT